MQKMQTNKVNFWNSCSALNLDKLSINIAYRDKARETETDNKTDRQRLPNRDRDSEKER